MKKNRYQELQEERLMEMLKNKSTEPVIFEKVGKKPIKPEIKVEKEEVMESQDTPIKKGSKNGLDK